MRFEYVPAKSVANKAKHGIDFDETQALWADEGLFEINASTEEEPRYLAIGMIGVRCWVAVYTWRAETIRIISIRRARPEELALYEG